MRRHHQPENHRLNLIFFACALAMAGITASNPARAQNSAATTLTVQRTVALPAQPLGQAINALAREWGVAISVDASLAAGHAAPAVQGGLTLAQALQRVLGDTGLVAAPSGSAIVIQRRNEATSALAPVTVTANAEPETATSPVWGYAAKRSATGTKTDTPLLEVPQSISVIGREEMEARGALDVMDAIRYAPGVTTSTYGPDNRGWEDVLLRGFNAYTCTYRDGLAQTPFGTDYYMTEPYGLERVEVLRGPSSMVFGQGDAGGIINRVSKQPNGARIREVELQYGSFQRQQLAFDLGDQLGDASTNSDLSYRLVGVLLDSNDQDQYSDGHKLNRTRTYLAPSLRWQPNAGTSFTLLGEYLKNKSSEDPYYFNANGQYLPIKMGDWSFSGIQQEQASLGYRFETRLNEDWTLRQNLRHTQISMDRRAVWFDSLDDDGHTVNRVARTWNEPLHQTALDTNVQGKLRTANTEHTLLIGVDWNRLKGKSQRAIGDAPTLDLNQPVYGQTVATPTRAMRDYQQTTEQLGVYVQDQIKWADRWVLTLGGRQDRVNATTDDHLNSERSEQHDNAFSGRAGVTYLAGQGVAPYLSYTESFLPNSGVDAQNQPFKPSRGKQVEAGVKFQPEGSRTLYTAAVFDLRKTNVVTYDPMTFEGRQVGRQRSRGLELEAKGEVLPGLNATASYTRTATRVLQSADPDEMGKDLPLVPDQSAAVWLDYVWGNGLGFGAGARYVGRRANDEYNTTFQGGATVFDAAVHFESGRWRLALNVSNLLNKEYFSICYHGECYRAAERAATLSAKYRF